MTTKLSIAIHYIAPAQILRLMVVKDVVDLTSKLSSWGAADPGRMDRESLASCRSSWYEECAYVRSKPLCDYYHSGCESRQPYSMGVHPSLLFHEQQLRDVSKSIGLKVSWITQPTIPRAPSSTASRRHGSRDPFNQRDCSSPASSKSTLLNSPDQSWALHPPPEMPDATQQSRHVVSVDLTTPPLKSGRLNAATLRTNHRAELLTAAHQVLDHTSPLVLPFH